MKMKKIMTKIIILVLKKYLPGYIKPTTLREVSKGFELLQQYKTHYKQYENIKSHLPII